MVNFSGFSVNIDHNNNVRRKIYRQLNIRVIFTDYIPKYYSGKEYIMKFLIKKSPDGFIKSVNDEISTILNRNFDSLFPEFVYNEDYADLEKLSMPVELHEHDGEYCVRAELPGVKKDDLDIDLEKNRLTINAKKEEESEEKESHYKKSEFRYGEFSRTIYFPEDIDIEHTTAKLEHGILKIDAPKKEADKEKAKKLIVK